MGRKMATKMGRGVVLLKFLSRNGSMKGQCHVQTKFLSTSTAFQSKSMTVRDALNSAIDEELAKDERVFVMGEEVAHMMELTKSPEVCGKNMEINVSLILQSQKWVS